MIDGFYIGPIRIHFYGILIMLGVLAAAWLADKEARRRNLDGEIIWDSLAYVLIGGIIKCIMPILKERLMCVHPRTVDTEDRLGHE